MNSLETKYNGLLNVKSSLNQNIGVAGDLMQTYNTHYIYTVHVEMSYEHIYYIYTIYHICCAIHGASL